MSSFELVFSLFGLLLGFALVEVLSGLVRITRERGLEGNWFLTTGLGLLFCLDLMTFWKLLYDMQGSIPANVLSLYIGFAIMGVYYWASSLIFPAKAERGKDLDEHFFEVRRRVLSAIIICNLAAYTCVSFMFGRPLWLVGQEGLNGTYEIAIFASLFLALMAVRQKVASAVLLSIILLSYIASAIIHF